MSGAIGKRLRLRLFIEGVEVPLIAANIQGAPNSPVAASLQVPPLESGTKLLPCSVVHVFFYDYAEAASGLVSLHGDMRSLRDTPGPSVYESTKQREKLQQEDSWLSSGQISQDERNQHYKLLFVGEIVGFTWTKSPTSRSLVLQCLDLSSYWDRAYQWSNNDLFGPGYKALFSGGNTNLFTDFLEEKGGAILRILNTPSSNYPGIKGLPGGMIHLIEAIGGFYYTNSGSGQNKQRDVYAGQNPFFSYAELRLHFTQMIHAYGKDTTAYKLMGPSWDSLFGRTLGNLGEQVSIRQALNSLCGLIFYETYSIPSPRYVPGSQGSVSGYVRRKAKNDPVGGKYVTVAASVVQSLLDMTTNITKYATDLEQLNVSQASVSSALAKTIGRQLTNLRALLNAIVGQARKENVTQLIEPFTKASTALTKAITIVQARTWKPTSATTSELLSHFSTAGEALYSVGDTEISYTAPKQAQPAKLIHHIVRPDVWFTAPPRCNIIFPDMYTQLTYGRQWLQEPTRLLLKTHDEFFGEDELFDNFYFAPKSPSTTSKQRATLQKVLQGGLLRHEIYTGIIPVFEKSGEFNIFAVRDGKVKGKQPKVGLAQRTANFLFFRYRFASRQLSTQSAFDPYVVPGFPSLVVDKECDPRTVDNYWEFIAAGNQPNRDLYGTLGTHFLGAVTQFAHSVAQAGGTSMFTIGMARQWEESTEFLNSIDEKQDQQVVKKYGDAVRKSYVAALAPPVVGTLGPNFGQITAVRDVTAEYLADNDSRARDVGTQRYLEGAQKLPLYTGNRSAGKGTYAQVPIGIPYAPKQAGDDVAQLLGTEASTPLVFRAYEVAEVVPKYRKETVDLPAEELIRPGWYGDCWHASNVGKIYEEWFGTGAITDVQQVVDAQGAEQVSSAQDAPDGLGRAFSPDAPPDAVQEFKQAPAVLALQEGASIQQAVAFFLLTYSYARQQGINTQGFIDSYKWRPIASLPDMFGSSDLQFSTPDGRTVVTGVEGFHSRAFGQYSDFFGLVTPEIKSILGFQPGSISAQELDVRKQRQDAVLTYVAQLDKLKLVLE